MEVYRGNDHVFTSWKDVCLVPSLRTNGPLVLGGVITGSTEIEYKVLGAG